MFQGYNNIKFCGTSKSAKGFSLEMFRLYGMSIRHFVKSDPSDCTIRYIAQNKITVAVYISVHLIAQISSSKTYD